ncbi:MAG: hypothetical protein KatS3mg020_0814 [Fimbriimonadales bacterium]|nr:MAG: hypothetical protein KatS3mg019_0391 [Fimbriimonadales bacterium]GIV11323.1 MAG: hypothetical protein KatS3mg020_0814 [Fimbriimonadales bacterium]
MRGISVVVALCCVALCHAQVDKTAEGWLQKSFQAYSQLQSLQSKTTLTVLMVTPRTPEGMPIQKYLYAYTAQAPARINLLVKDTNAQGEGQRYMSDGQTFMAGSESKPIANSGAALLEQLAEVGVAPSYDLVFLHGGKTSQERFRNQITQLQVVGESEKQVTLAGRIKNERGKEDTLEIVIDKESLLMRALRIRSEVKIEDQPGAFVLVMEFEPTPNVAVSEQTWTMK